MPSARLWYRLCRFYAQGLYACFFAGRAFGREHVALEGGVLLVCNHQSFLDPVLATLALDRECDYMARDTLFRQPLFRRLIESLNAFPIKRAAADVGAIKETIRRLRAGHLITVFPEGTRTPDGKIRAMQAGPVLIARKAGVPIVPTLIWGAFEAWPRHAHFPRPHRIMVAYGEPLWSDDMQGLENERCIGIVRGRIIELAERYGWHIGGAQREVAAE